MMPETPVDEHLRELVLGGAAGGLRGEDRGVALAGQGLADDLGERREYGVLQLRRDQADQSGGALAQPHGPLVAEDVERGKHGLAGGSGHPGLPLSTRLTVASLTPACAAMSASRAVTGWDCTGRASDCPPSTGRRVRAVERPAADCCVMALPRVTGMWLAWGPWGSDDPRVGPV